MRSPARGMTEVSEGHGPGSPTLPGAAVCESTAPPDQRAAATATRTPVGLTSSSLMSSLPPAAGFDFDPGLLEPYLVVDNDGLPLGSLGAASPTPALPPEDSAVTATAEALDALMDESVSDSEDEAVVARTLNSLYLRALSPEDSSTKPVPSFEDVFGGFDADDDEDNLRLASPPDDDEDNEASDVASVDGGDHEDEESAVDDVPPPETQLVIVHTKPLPRHPKRHPGNHHVNHYNPHASWDPRREYGLSYLLDRHGDPPNRAYLVMWKTMQLQFSWVWGEQLAAFEDLKECVDKWVEAGRPGTFFHFADMHFGGATASETGRCFMEAVHAACYHLGNLSLITEDHWKRFEEEHKREMTYGVKKEQWLNSSRSLSAIAFPWATKSCTSRWLWIH